MVKTKISTAQIVAIGLVTSSVLTAAAFARTRLHPGLAPAVEPQAPTAALVNDEEQTPDVLAGTVVIQPDVLARCRALKGFQAKGSATGDDSVEALKSVARCMTSGELRSARLVVTGDDDGRDLVLTALDRVGIAPNRVTQVATTSPAGNDAPRVTIGLKKGEPAPRGSLSIAIDRRRAVGLLVMDTFD